MCFFPLAWTATRDISRSASRAPTCSFVTAWQKRSQSLVENFKQTDLFGALVMSSQIFEPRDGRRNVLVIFSDMRHETPSLNLAKFSVVPLQPTLDGIASAGLTADLKGVEVYVLGVDAAGKSVGYWNSLRDFWLRISKKLEQRSAPIPSCATCLRYRKWTGPSKALFTFHFLHPKFFPLSLSVTLLSTSSPIARGLYCRTSEGDAYGYCEGYLEKFVVFLAKPYSFC